MPFLSVRFGVAILKILFGMVPRGSARGNLANPMYRSLIVHH